MHQQLRLQPMFEDPTFDVSWLSGRHLLTAADLMRVDFHWQCLGSPPQ